jgi:hypothetical protein
VNQVLVHVDHVLILVMTKVMLKEKENFEKSLKKKKKKIYIYNIVRN